MAAAAAAAAPFPPRLRAYLKAMPGNGTCVDCGSPDTDWGDVMYGVLLCVQCGGRHRGIGSHLSTVKSLSMDLWTRNQMRSLLLGGNKQLQGWFIKCNAHKSDIDMKYRSKAATLYRKKLAEAVQAAEEEERQKGVADGSTDHWMEWVREDGSHAGYAVALSTKEAYKDEMRKERIRAKEVEKEEARRVKREERREAHAVKRLQHFSFPKERSAGEYDIQLGEGKLGFSLVKDSGSRSAVSSVFAGGPAERLGVQQGDFLVGLNGQYIYDYDDMMRIVKSAKRPIVLRFQGSTIVKRDTPDLSAQGPAAAPAVLATAAAAAAAEAAPPQNTSGNGENVNVPLSPAKSQTRSVPSITEDQSSDSEVDSTGIAGRIDESFFESDGEFESRARGQPRGNYSVRKDASFTVSFGPGRLGFTIVKSTRGTALIASVKHGGQGYRRGLERGLIITHVDSTSVQNYEEAMNAISSAPRPVNIAFARPGTDGSDSSNPGVPVKGGLMSSIMEAANSLANSLGIGIASAQCEPHQVRFPSNRTRAHVNSDLKAIPSSILGGYGKRAPSYDSQWVVPEEMMADLPMTTKHFLSESEIHAKDFEVAFGDGDLGFTLEERGWGGSKPFTYVAKVACEGQARESGVTEGCVVMGLNGEKYLGHSYTVATIKYGQRPVHITFRQP